MTHNLSDPPFFRFKLEPDSVYNPVKRVKKEVPGDWGSDTNNNSDTPTPPYYTMDQSHLHHHQL